MGKSNTRAGAAKPAGEVAVVARALWVDCAEVWDEFKKRPHLVVAPKVRLTPGGVAYVLLPYLLRRGDIAVAVDGGKELWVRPVDPATLDAAYGTAADPMPAA